MATKIDTTTHASLITKAEKLGIDAEFYDDVESLKAACRQAAEKSMLTRLAELSIEEKKMTSPLYIAKELGKNFSDTDFQSADKYLTMESKYKQKESELRLSDAYAERLASRLSR